MTAEEIKLRRAELRAEKKLASDKAYHDLLVRVIENPMVGMIAGVILLESLEKANLLGPIITTTTETGLISIGVAKALGPVLSNLGTAAAPLAAKAAGLLL